MVDAKQSDGFNKREFRRKKINVEPA